MNTVQIRNTHILFFIDDFCERISRSYNENIISIVDEMPIGIVNYNNIPLLKKAQKFVRHTDAIFNKSISTLFAALFRENGFEATTPHDRQTRCVYLKDTGEYFHFIPFEQFACFPKVGWYKGLSSASSINTYVVLIENNERGQSLVKKANELCPGPKEFVIIEEFVTEKFSGRVWDEVKESFKQIEKVASRYQWFDLAEICSDYNKEQFNTFCEHELLNKNYSLEIPPQHLQILMANFKKRYQILLSDTDFARSYFTSEWLFNKQMRNDNLDKTYIVSGYLKSIEQLLAYCIKKSAGNDMIEVFNGGQVQISSDQFAKATLGNMQHYIGSFENRDIFDSRLSNRTIQLLNKHLAQWIKKERNGYFHKDNVSRIEIVSQIRDATYNIYLLLLGSMAV